MKVSKMSDECIVLLSGGQDSTTCLYWAKEKFKKVHALTINYGQRHSLELKSAKKIALIAGVESHEILDINNILKGTSPLTNNQEVVEEYESVEVLPGGLEKTFVPGRNILFLTLVANRAYCLGTSNIVIGVSQEDFGGYPDCRIEFISAMEEALSKGLGNEFYLYTPLIYKTKKQTVEIAASLEGCLNALKYSHTCYNGVNPPCGKCHACLLREKGFKEAGIVDPIFSRKE